MPEDYSVDKSISEGTSVFVGNVIHSAADGCTIEVRNTIRSGDTLEVLTPDGQLSEITLSVPLKTVAGEYRDIATNGQFIQLPVFLPEFSILRRLGDIKLQKSS